MLATPAATITVTFPHPGLVPVSLGAEVDLAALHWLDAAVREAGACPEVAVEASGVDFIDYAGLRPLLAAARSAGAGGGRLVLGDPSPALAELIAWCHLGEGLPDQTVRAPHRRGRGLNGLAGGGAGR